jgi:DNA-binding MarR family transcriptional regulator
MDDDAPVPAHRGTHGLHRLVARLDRAADRILRAELDVSYPHFLLLLTLQGLGPVTQRSLADELGVTEPTVSRSVAPLAGRGLLTVTTVSGQGHRRSVALTADGRALVTACSERLEAAFEGLLDQAGVRAAELDDATARLLKTLDGGPPPTRS